MTDEERALTLAAIDAACSQQIGKLFAVFCSAGTTDTDSGLAAERFEAGLRVTIRAREMALDATTDIIEGGL